MKRPILLCIGWCLISISASAQTTKDSLVRQITKETCDELSGVDFSNKTSDELKISVGLSFAKIAGKHQDELKSIGVTLSDPQSVGALGREIGVQLVTSCPTFVTAMTKTPGFVNEAIQSAKGISTGTVSGKLLKIVEGEFTYLQVEDTNGKIQKLWWLEYFDGSNKLIGNANNELSKPIKVTYVEKEVFNSILKDYVKIKMITRID
jgi:hypothetical protein